MSRTPSTSPQPAPSQPRRHRLAARKPLLLLVQRALTIACLAFVAWLLPGILEWALFNSGLERQQPSGVPRDHRGPPIGEGERRLLGRHQRAVRPAHVRLLPCRTALATERRLRAPRRRAWCRSCSARCARWPSALAAFSPPRSRSRSTPRLRRGRLGHPLRPTTFVAVIIARARLLLRPRAPEAILAVVLPRLTRWWPTSSSWAALLLRPVSTNRFGGFLLTMVIGVTGIAGSCRSASCWRSDGSPSCRS